MKPVDKRQRLVEAAAQTLHAGGYANTTLARVAAAARVPLGNVFYYFKTKDSLAEAVIEAREAELLALFAAAEQRVRPADRLIAVLNVFAEQANGIARSGCPYGSLAQDLNKQEGQLGVRARRLLERQAEWMTRQYRAMGKGRTSQALALELLGAVQGASLVAHAMGDPALLRRRLDELAATVRRQAKKS